MAPSSAAQRRTHNLLLFQKLLNLRDGASPFTLILDTLEQSAQPALREFMRRAKISKTKIIFVSFQTIQRPKLADVSIKARGKPLSALCEEILIAARGQSIPKPSTATPAPTTKTLIILDNLHPLCTHPHATQLSAFLSSLLGPGISLLAVYHLDIPLPSPLSAAPHSFGSVNENEYAPNPLTLLTYLATAILKVFSLAHTLEKKRARDRSVPEPGFGLEEDREGVLFGLSKSARGNKNESGDNGVVVEMEVRRRSGRGVKEIFVLFTNPKDVKATAIGGNGVGRAGPGSKMCLLDDHPLYAPPAVGGTEKGRGNDEIGETTFNLGLTEKQKRDREGVVLPYFDAQSGEGVGEGGRILYEMDRGDDFDEEEDEI